MAQWWTLRPEGGDARKYPHLQPVAFDPDGILPPSRLASVAALIGIAPIIPQRRTPIASK